MRRKRDFRNAQKIEPVYLHEVSADYIKLAKTFSNSLCRPIFARTEARRRQCIS
jgi:hypothetical protein